MDFYSLQNYNNKGEEPAKFSIKSMDGDDEPPSSFFGARMGRG